MMRDRQRAMVDRAFYPAMKLRFQADDNYTPYFYAGAQPTAAQTIGTLIGTAGSGVIGGVLSAQQAKLDREQALAMAKATANADAAHAEAAARSAEAFSNAVPWVAGAVMLATAAYLYTRFHARSI